MAAPRQRSKQGRAISASAVLALKNSSARSSTPRAATGSSPASARVSHERFKSPAPGSLESKHDVGKGNGSSKLETLCRTQPQLANATAEASGVEKVRVLDEFIGSGFAQDTNSIDDLIENISASELEEIRSLKHPPIVVKRALEATCLLLLARQPPKDLKPPDWTTVQRMMTDTKFLFRVLSYNVENLRAAPKLLAFVRAEYFESKHCSHVDGMAGSQDVLTYERVSRANKAAGALFRWTSMTIGNAETPPFHDDMDPMLEGVEAQKVEIKTVTAVVTDPETPGAEDAALTTSSPSVVRLRPDRHFETYVPSLPYAMATSITMEVIEEIVHARPQLCLELSAYTDPVEAPKAMERLCSVKDFLASKGIECRLAKEMHQASQICEPGITCTIHLDEDEELIQYLRSLRDANRNCEGASVSNNDADAEEDTLRPLVDRIEKWFDTRMHV